MSDNEEPSHIEPQDASEEQGSPADGRPEAGGLPRLNALSKEEATAELLRCCGSTNWVRLVAASRPFHDERELFEATDRVWWSLNRVDWLEAFSSHPKIGEQKAEADTGPEAERWAQEEQSETRTAAPETLAALAEENRAYEGKFGFIYIVCATGRSADQMLALVKRRLGNDAETELCVAAEEQRRITQLRLRKLLNL